jgi:hypothetical protein
MSRVTPMFGPIDAGPLSVSFSIFAKACEDRAYDDTSAEECASWLHSADLARQLANALKRVQQLEEEGHHAR